MDRFILEILAFILIFLLLRRIWNNKVKQTMGQIVVGINVFAIFLYVYGIMNQSIPFELALPKVFLHGLVAIIIHTLFTLDQNSKE
tara:strand:- start:2276 stop:2533 length:258 start_codon:yes stop_codon:yes gene_type:complete